MRLLEHTLTGHTGCMTPAYAAPEFFNNQTSNQSDQYSLAVTYCHLRGGRLPFTGSLADLMAGHLMKEPDLTMLPEAERPVVARAMAKEPKERWPNCREFIEAIRTACTPPAIRTRSPSRRSDELIRFTRHSDDVNCVTFSADGNRALSGGDDAMVRMWDIESGEELVRFEGHSEPVRSIAGWR